MRKCNLCLPATIISSTDASGIAYTWAAPSGDHKHRIDYIAVPLPWLPSLALIA